MLALLPDGLVYALAGAVLVLVTVALAFGLAAYLLHFCRRRSRPPPLPDATPPAVEAPPRYDSSASTAPMRRRVGPWGGAPGPASTLSTTPEGVADQLEATGSDEAKDVARSLRESANRPIKAPPDLRGLVSHRDQVTKPKGDK